MRSLPRSLGIVGAALLAAACSRKPASIDVSPKTLKIYGIDRAQRLTGLIPGADLHVIDGAGHLIQLDQPVALATALTGWLLRQGTST